MLWRALLMLLLRLADMKRGAVYLYDTLFALEETLTASLSSNGDRFGYALSLKGDSIAVGAPNVSGGGAGYVYKKLTSGSWSLISFMQAPVQSDGDMMGCSAAVAAEGGVRVYFGSCGSSTGAGDVTCARGCTVVACCPVT